MKKQYVFSFFALTALFLLGGFTPSAFAMPNPMVEYSSIEEAESAIGVTLPQPAVLPKGYAITAVFTIGKTVIQATYKNTENKEICYRAAKGTDDISGIYGQYEEKTMDIGGVQVLTKWSKDGIILARWNTNTQTFSISFDKAVDPNFLTSFFQSLPVNPK